MNGIPATAASAVIGVVLAVLMLVLATLTVALLEAGRALAAGLAWVAASVRHR